MAKTAPHFKELSVDKAARNRGLIWQKPWPNLKLIGALEGTQVAGTLAAVY